jgi:gas vesicle protein
MASTEQLEREAELTRAQLAASLDELRAITPGRVIDEILGYAKSGSAELLRGIGHQVVEHPLPATLIGAGLAWLIMSNGSSSRGTVYDTASRSSAGGNWFSDTARSAGSATDTIRDRAGSAVQGLKDSAQSAVSGVGDTLDSTTGMVKEKAQSAMASLSDTASGIGESISNAYGTVADKVSWTANNVADAAARITPSQDELMQAGQRIWDYCKDQPLVVAGLGIALGAAIGTCVPQTEAENRLMGEAADQLKDKAQRFASDPLKQANDMAKSLGERIVDEAAKIAKQEVSNFVDSWGSKGDSGVQSDQQESGSQMGQSGSSQGGQRPFH